MKIKMVISYDGSKFHGFQRLNKERSVQKEMETALSKIMNEEIEIKGAGRTDAGVHANYQVVSFDASNKDKNLKDKLNKLVNPDIVIKKITYVSNDFHPRFSAKKKEYVYKINVGNYKSSLNDYYLQDNFKYDLSLMREAAKILIGTHDFINFVSGEKENTIATIESIDINKAFNKIEIRFIGDHFYKYMVRNLVGALLEIGKFKEKYTVIDDMLDKKVKKVLPTAPASGLYLNKIWY